MGEEAIYAAAGRLATEWLAALEGAEDEAALRLRYLVARAAERAGLLYFVRLAMRGGRPVIVLAEPLGGALFEVADPELGEDEARLVDAIEWVLFGGATPLRAARPQPDGQRHTGQREAGTAAAG